VRKRTGRGRIERFLFSFMGPPELGDPHAPQTVARDEEADRCPRCGQPWAVHERVTTGTFSYRRCPEGRPTSGS
jgi:hypothetical protein